MSQDLVPVMEGAAVKFRNLPRQVSKSLQGLSGGSSSQLIITRLQAMCPDRCVLLQAEGS